MTLEDFHFYKSFDIHKSFICTNFYNLDFFTSLSRCQSGIMNKKKVLIPPHPVGFFPLTKHFPFLSDDHRFTTGRQIEETVGKRAVAHAGIGDCPFSIL